VLNPIPVFAHAINLCWPSRRTPDAEILIASPFNFISPARNVASSLLRWLVITLLFEVFAASIDDAVSGEMNSAAELTVLDSM